MLHPTPTALTTHLDPFRSPVVRDLVWAILSPTLIVTPDASHYCSPKWFELAFESIALHLQQLEQDDAPLRQHLNTPPTHRLGIRFERLWSYWLQHNGRYELLAANVQVPHNGNTLGEFDFIVHDNHANEIEHWELALKFYLGIPPLTSAQHWFGPNLKDRLDLKQRHLAEKQLPLSQTHAGQTICQQNGWNISRRRLICKGRLYYPEDNSRLFPRCIDPAHQTGRWLTHTQLRTQLQHANATIRLLEKDEWMVSHFRQTSLVADTPPDLQPMPTHPIQVELTAPHQTPQRIFVVPDDWQQQAASSLAANPS